MSFDQDPNEMAQISGSDFAQMCDEMKQLRAERDALAKERDENHAIATGLQRALSAVDAELADERAKKSDALIAAVNDIERLTAERDEASAEIAAVKQSSEFHDKLGITLLDAEYLDPACHKGCQSIKHHNDLAAAQQTVARLRAALEKYGEHQGVCPKKYHGRDSRPCTCGLDEALATPAK